MSQTEVLNFKCAPVYTAAPNRLETGHLKRNDQVESFHGGRINGNENDFFLPELIRQQNWILLSLAVKLVHASPNLEAISWLLVTVSRQLEFPIPIFFSRRRTVAREYFLDS